MADGWEQIDGFSTTRSYADDVRMFLESQKAQLQLEDLAAAGPYWPIIPGTRGGAGSTTSDSEDWAASSESSGQQQHGVMVTATDAGGHGVGPVSWEQQRAAHMEVLALDPPHWLPDSFASACGGCHLQFVPFRRLKHHCRWEGRNMG